MAVMAGIRIHVALAVVVIVAMAIGFRPVMRGDIRSVMSQIALYVLIGKYDATQRGKDWNQYNFPHFFPLKYAVNPTLRYCLRANWISSNHKKAFLCSEERLEHTPAFFSINLSGMSISIILS
jgi:hypothetical protein